jgi:multiple sugar transport system permease protein
MSPTRPLGLAAAGMMALAGLAALVVARWKVTELRRDEALEAAQEVAAYIPSVTPLAKGGTGYDLSRLLIQAHGLDALPGWTLGTEVFHGTAPLVHGTATPLSAMGLERLRQRDVTGLVDGGTAVLTPLKDRDGWDVVGAVRVSVAGGGWLFSGWALPAFVLLVLSGLFAATRLDAPDLRFRSSMFACAGCALLVGITAYGQVRSAAREITERRLFGARALIEEAAIRRPLAAPETLGRIAPAADLLPGGGSSEELRRSVQDGVARAEVSVHSGLGRWWILRVIATEATIGAWSFVPFGIMLLGPLGVLLCRWLQRVHARPRVRSETLAAWGFLAPSAMHLAVFSCAPLLYLLYLSVHRWSGGPSPLPLVGLGNFATTVRDPLTWRSLFNTALYTLHVPVAMAIALLLALLLHRTARSVRFVQSLFFLPYAASVVAIALLWQRMYQPDFGLFNGVRWQLGLLPFDWLGNPRTALLAVMAISMWAQVGYQLVVFLAGLQAIPPEYLDAARVDGAGRWRRFWRVTFPLLKPVTLFVLVTGVITSFQVFTLVYILTGGGPQHATDVVAFRIYQTAWQSLQFGQGSALSLLLLALLCGVTWTQVRLLGKRVAHA